ncbi:MAG: HAD family hydrolase [Chloroflexota bacterium]|nr:HAD family hydrolase [Chloroflexota bacterium]
MIRALVFDFDGLILETETPAYETWAAIYKEHGHVLPMDRWHAYIGSDTGFDPAGHLATLVGEGFDRDATQTRRDARKTELIAALDVMDGVREYVADAKRLGLRLAVASSSSRTWVLGHLERLRLHAEWDAVRTREDVARTKPAPDLYLAAAEALGVEPHEAVAFEDSGNGIAAAKDAGLLCVAVPNALTGGMDLSRADLRLASLAEMPLERLLAVLSAL